MHESACIPRLCARIERNARAHARLPCLQARTHALQARTLWACPCAPTHSEQNKLEHTWQSDKFRWRRSASRCACCTCTGHAHTCMRTHV